MPKIIILEKKCKSLLSGWFCQNFEKKLVKSNFLIFYDLLKDNNLDSPFGRLMDKETLEDNKKSLKEVTKTLIKKEEEIAKNIEKEICEILPTEITRDLVIYDCTPHERGIGGFNDFLGKLTNIIPLFEEPVIKFVIEGLIANFLYDRVKEFWQFLKSKVVTKSFKSGPVLVEIKDTKKESITSFYFFEYFDKKTFVEAWSKMKNHKKAGKKESEFNIYDTKMKKWITINKDFLISEEDIK